MLFKRGMGQRLFLNLSDYDKIYKLFLQDDISVGKLSMVRTVILMINIQNIVFSKFELRRC